MKIEKAGMQSKSIIDNFFTKKKNNSERYFCIPNAEDPRIIVPLKNKKLFKAGLSIHNTASGKNKLLKSIISLSYPLSSLLKSKIVFSTDSLNSFITQVNKNTGNNEIKNYSVYCGTKGNLNRKLTFLLMDDYGKKLGIVKYPLSKESSDFITNEFEALELLKGIKFNNIVIPQKSVLIDINGILILYQENIFSNANSLPPFLNELITDASVELGNKTLKHDSQTYFNEYRGKLKTLNLDKTIQAKVESIITNVVNHKIPVVTIHGDFVSYNMKTKNGKILLIDWEFSRQGLPLFDLFHFIFQTGIQVRKISCERILFEVLDKNSDNYKFLAYYLNKLGMDEILLRDLFALYLADAFYFDIHLREQNSLSENNFLKTLSLLLSDNK